MKTVGFIIACWIFPGFGSEPFILVANRKSVITSSCSLLWRTPSKLGEYVMSRFDSHSLTLYKIILVFKRLHAPLNSVIGKRGWKYNILQAKLHISDYAVRRAGTLCHLFITSFQYSITIWYRAVGRTLLCLAWKCVAFMVSGICCRRSYVGLFHTSF